MRQFKWVLFSAAAIVALAVVYLTYPLGGKVWSTSQIAHASVGKSEVPPQRYRELWRDLKQGTDSKCPETVELVLRNGERLTMWLDPHLAEKYDDQPCGS